MTSFGGSWRFAVSSSSWSEHTDCTLHPRPKSLGRSREDTSSVSSKMSDFMRLDFLWKLEASLGGAPPLNQENSVHGSLALKLSWRGERNRTFGALPPRDTRLSTVYRAAMSGGRQTGFPGAADARGLSKICAQEPGRNEDAWEGKKAGAVSRNYPDIERIPGTRNYLPSYVADYNESTFRQC